MKPLKLTVATCLLASIVPNLSFANNDLNTRIEKNEAEIKALKN